MGGGSAESSDGKLQCALSSKNAVSAVRIALKYVNDKNKCLKILVLCEF